MPKVFINPGHDLALDSGCVGVYNDALVRECDIVAEVGNLVEKYLQAAGVQTYLMQSDDLYTVVQRSNDGEYDLFVSIHCNSIDNQYPQGTETLVYFLGGGSEDAAQCIQDQIVDNLGTFDRGVKVRKDLYVLRETTSPAVLVEIGFLSNDEDIENIMTNKDEFARAIARGVTDYFTEGQANYAVD